MTSTNTFSSTCLEEESSVLRREKQASIQRCLSQKSVDLWQLRELALSKGGLVNAEMRKRAWHILVGLNHLDKDPSSSAKGDKDSSCCLDEKELELIRCDAGRSVLFRYHGKNNTNANDTADDDDDDNAALLPSGESTSQHDLRPFDQQEQLATILISTLSDDSKLHYYQGLHDIAGVLLHTLQDAHHVSAIMKRLARVHLRDAMREDLTSLVNFLNATLMPLVESVDSELHDFLYQSGLECSNAILPWVLSWFSHDIHDEQVASRLMDAFLSAHALFPLYFAVAVLVHPRNRVDIFQADFDPASIHMTIRSLTSRICDDWVSYNETFISSQDLIDDAITFMRQHPPRTLTKLASEYSGRDLQSYMEIAASVSLLRAPPSWALAASMTMHHQCEHDKENVGAKNERTWIDGEKESTTARSKCASGVPFLMSAVDDVIVLSKRLATSSTTHTSPRSVATRWELCQQAFFGSFSVEDACASSPFFSC